MLVLAGKIHHLVDLGFGDFISEHPANPDALLVDVEHYPGRLVHIHLEEPLEHDDHEFHRGVIVIQQQHFELARLLGLGPRFGGNPDLMTAIAIALVAILGGAKCRIGRGK